MKPTYPPLLLQMSPAYKPHIGVSKFLYSAPIVYFVIHTTSSAPVMKGTGTGIAGPMVQTGAARGRSLTAERINDCLRRLQGAPV